MEEMINKIKNDPSVEYVQPNFIYYPREISTDDIHKDTLWGLYNEGQEVNGVFGSDDKDIDSPEAWKISEGDNDEVIVAIIDSGVAYNHPDLIDNMWDGDSCEGFDKEGVPLSGGCLHGYDYEDGDLDPFIESYLRYNAGL